MILSMATPWLGTDCAVYEPVNVPRSAWLQRSRTVAAPAGIPSDDHCTVMDAAEVPRLKSTTARALVPDSVFDTPGDSSQGLPRRAPEAPGSLDRRR